MKNPVFTFFALLVLALALPAYAGNITYTIIAPPNPTDLERTNYALIEKAFMLATSRWARLVPRRGKILTVSWNPDLPAHDSGSDDYWRGHINFGTAVVPYEEYVVLHEISRALGIGTTLAWTAQCQEGGGWPLADALLTTFDGYKHGVQCAAGGKMQPYGLNGVEENGEVPMDRHVLLVDAEIQDMGAGTGEFDCGWRGC